MEYLEDYSSVQDLTEEELQKNEIDLDYTIYLENLNGEQIAQLKNNDGETKVIETVKSNIDRFTKKIITLENGSDGNLIVKKVEQE